MKSKYSMYKEPISNILGTDYRIKLKLPVHILQLLLVLLLLLSLFTSNATTTITTKVEGLNMKISDNVKWKVETN